MTGWRHHKETDMFSGQETTTKIALSWSERSTLLNFEVARGVFGFATFDQAPRVNHVGLFYNFNDEAFLEYLVKKT